MKVIPLYLPQFHTTPENDKWWGEGFTEWVNVKNAKPLYEGHSQPRIPQNNNYYDLRNVATLRWQADLANEYGIYGFCFYHYWFNGKLLLEKPMELLLQNQDINLKYCLSWANGEWRDTWKCKDRKSTKILIADDFNNEELWVDHFNYLLQFFKDPRYITENDKPILVIYSPHIIPKLNKMLDLWTNMAKENGLNGITYIYQSASASFDKTWDRSRFSYGIEMNPGYANEISSKSAKLRSTLYKYTGKFKRLFHIKRSLIPSKNNKELQRKSYDETWNKILSLRPSESTKMIPCAFTDWDNTPRFGINGWCYDGVTVAKFKSYFKQLLLNTRKYYDSDMMFIFAWNEWAEGGYLEPDELYGDGFLNSIKSSLIELNEYES